MNSFLDSCTSLIDCGYLGAPSYSHDVEQTLGRAYNSRVVARVLNKHVDVDMLV